MARPISQPALSDSARATLATIDRARDTRSAPPATGITRLDIPFEDVFFFALKLFAAFFLIGVAIGAILSLAWFLVLR